MPVLVAGSISVGPLALFVLPQAKGRVTEYRVGSYAPRSLAAATFFVHNLGLFVSQLIASPVPTDRVLPLLFWLALAMGSVVRFVTVGSARCSWPWPARWYCNWSLRQFNDGCSPCAAPESRRPSVRRQA